MIPEYANFLKYAMSPLVSTSKFEQTLRAVLDSATKKKTHRERDLVDRVLHNPPATIVFWKDKTKTVVKQQDGDVYDPEKGFMAACTKKFFGNDNQFNYEIKWYVPKLEEVYPDPVSPVEETLHNEAIEQIEEATPEADAVIKEFADVMFGGTYSGPTC